ncbi:MAG TPA: LON peptidase substrate-binding domain-containing protein [Alphaproteobacteria bacterium]|nr:LON peptidase substrate-binding domain-containing protein [Alphaproteobacteria bacterium]
MNQPDERMSEELPGEIPIFPLTGVLLLPHGRLPLNIFEPRYLAMVEDAIKGARVIGMVQPQEADSEARVAEPEVYRVGCAGRITMFRETSDGRYEIVLDGVSRFEIARETGLRRGYRMAAVQFENFAGDGAPMDDEVLDSMLRAKLLVGLEQFLTGRGASLNGTGIAELPDRELIAAISMSCPFGPGEKQALLEAETPGDAAALLVALLEMASFEETGAPVSRQ